MSLSPPPLCASVSSDSFTVSVPFSRLRVFTLSRFHSCLAHGSWLIAVFCDGVYLSLGLSLGLKKKWRIRCIT